MAIRIPKMPNTGSHEAIARYLARPHARPVMQGIDLENVGASEPYPVYLATLDDLESGTLPQQPSHWRHLLVGEEGAVGEADIATEDEGARVVALHRGPRAAGTARALEGAESLDRVQKTDYELRLLESPAIHLVAVWLHASNDETLIAVEPDQTGLPRHEPVSFDQALPRLRELAAFVRNAQTTNPGPSGA